MRNVTNMFNRQRKALIYLTALFVLGWGFTPFKAVFLGLALGTVGAVFTHITHARFNLRFGDAVVNGTKLRNTGFMTRVAIAVLAVMLALEYPAYISFYATIFGLITIYIVIMIDFLVFELLLPRKKRGEKDES